VSCSPPGEGTGVTLVVTRTLEGSPHVIAAGSYLSTGDRTDEVVVGVADAFRGKGRGSLLLERLALLTAARGLTRFRAVTELSNVPMLDVLRASGFEVREHADGGAVEADLTLVLTAATVERQETRDQVAAVASLSWDIVGYSGTFRPGPNSTRRDR